MLSVPGKTEVRKKDQDWGRGYADKALLRRWHLRKDPRKSCTWEGHPGQRQAKTRGSDNGVSSMFQEGYSVPQGWTRVCVCVRGQMEEETRSGRFHT